MTFEDSNHPHQGQPVLEKGRKPEDASAAVILLHGRGASADSILTLERSLRDTVRSDLAWLAPQANYHTWYPYHFIQPEEKNEPSLTSALKIVGELLERLSAAGIPREKTVIAGFSQGACLSLEYAGRNPGRDGGILALSGGLIGETVDDTKYQGSMDETPVFLGCSDYDPHIPEDRVHESAEVFDRLGADVTKKIYEGLGHTINKDELNYFRKMLEAL